MIVKACGLRNADDALFAVDCGANAIGINFYPLSPRFVAEREAEAICRKLEGLAIRVGVFVGWPERDYPFLDAFQIHGLQAEEEFPWPAAGRELWIACSAEAAPRYRDRLVVIDSSWGQGVLADWEKVATLRQPFVLSGGLDATNVKSAIQRLRPAGIDVCSGIESAPGVKDRRKIRGFMQAVRGIVLAGGHESRGSVRRPGGPRPRMEIAGRDPAPATPVHRFEGQLRREPVRGECEMDQAAKKKPADLGKEAGRFGAYGGRFVPETLVSPLEELEAAYLEASRDPGFNREFEACLKNFVGRPTALTPAGNLSRRVSARVYLKREDLCHTGAHKINNALGQALLARRMGKRRIIAETGAGQHGVATATVCALLGLECEIYMGTEDMRRQALNVFRMQLLGARVRPVDAGSRTLKDAINEAMRDWVTHVRSTHYLLGSVLGAHPYPTMVRNFQSVIGREARRQILEAEGRLPEQLIACVGGGSNSIGLFFEFLSDPGVRMLGVEAAGTSLAPGGHAARFQGGRPGILHGTFSYLLQDDQGQVLPTHSISAGLDYPSIGPEHAMLRESGRVEYGGASDEKALEAFHLLSRLEGIIPALESAHAVAGCLELADSGRLAELGSDPLVIINLSGRGDKDVETVRDFQK